MTVQNKNAVSVEIPPALRAAVIDDAFDKIEEGQISFAKLRSFYQVASTNQHYSDAAQHGRFDQLDFDELEEDSEEYLRYLNSLWNSRDHSDEFRLLLQTRLFETRFEKLEQLESICNNLTKLNINVTKIGSDLDDDLDHFTRNEYNLVFMDFYLGAVEDEKAIESAAKNIKLIHSKYPEGRKPATVLMSSANVEDRAEEFYKKNKIMVTPRFYHKRDLQDDGLVSLITGILRREFQSRDQLENYAEAITIAAQQALDTFKENILKLSVEDFVFIQHSVLQLDKQPLGDYIAWLFSSYWGDLLFRNESLQNKANLINEIYVLQQPIMHRQPSKILSDIYMSALFESPGDDLVDHPAFESSPYLHIGDILASEYHNDVWMIVNPQCDLERLVPPNRSIFLGFSAIPAHTHLTLPMHRNPFIAVQKFNPKSTQQLPPYPSLLISEQIMLWKRNM